MKEVTKEEIINIVNGGMGNTYSNNPFETIC